MYRNGSLQVSKSWNKGETKVWGELLSNVAKVSNIWFNSPIPIERFKQFVFVEESATSKHIRRNGKNRVSGKRLPRIKATHVMVRFHTAIHDSSIPLTSNSLLGPRVIHPIRKPKHWFIDLSKLYRTTRSINHSSLKTRIEMLIIQKHIRIIKPPIEMSFNRVKRIQHSF